jgi:hypothetical protein
MSFDRDTKSYDPPDDFDEGEDGGVLHTFLRPCRSGLLSLKNTTWFNDRHINNFIQGSRQFLAVSEGWSIAGSK